MYVDHDGHMQLLVIALIAGVISAGTNIILSLVGQSAISAFIENGIRSIWYGPSA